MRNFTYLLAIVSMVIVANIGVAKVPQMSIRQNNGTTTHIELEEEFSLTHETVNPNLIPDAKFNFPSGKTIGIPTSEIEECRMVNPALPALSFHFPDHPDATQVWLKEDYINATLDVHGNGVLDDQLGLELTVKGRGNTSWYMSKKPMRLKFSKKTALCGFKKAKSFVLLANYIDQTHMHNMVALWLGQQLGLEYTNHFQPVDVFINDQYVGLFLLTEKVGINSGSVDINEYNGILFELSVEFDEPYKFRSETYNLPVMVKDPDFDELSETAADGLTAEERLALWQEDFNAAEEKVASGHAFDAIDLESAVKYLMVYDITRNNELWFPKSGYIYKEALGEDAMYKIGPIWDFDASQDFKFVKQDEIQTAPWDDTLAIHPFFRNIIYSDVFVIEYIKLFNKFYTTIYPELINFVDKTAIQIEQSAELDGNRWCIFQSFSNWAAHIPSTDYAEKAADHRQWIIDRVEYLKTQIDKGIVLGQSLHVLTQD